MCYLRSPRIIDDIINPRRNPALDLGSWAPEKEWEEIDDVGGCTNSKVMKEVHKFIVAVNGPEKRDNYVVRS